MTSERTSISSARAPSSSQAPVFTTVLLVLALAFATSTVFVREAWALQAFQVGVYILFIAGLLGGLGKNKQALARGIAPFLVYLIPLWGVLQNLAHTSASSFETRAEYLKWGSLAAVFFVSQLVGGTSRGRTLFLRGFLCFATALAVLCLMQLFTSEGRVLWLFSTGYPDVYGSFPYHNNYAEFVELALPVALWGAIRERGAWWAFALSAGVLYASVIGSASRSGAILCTAELAVVPLIGLLRTRRDKRGRSPRSIAAILLTVPVLAVVSTLIVGWGQIAARFRDHDPYYVRREFVISGIQMARHKPLIGFGLGTFPEVYQQYAIKDFPFYANHAHNDWVEFAADGGIPFLLLVLIPFGAAVPSAMRNPWGFGVVAIMIHACVDYPFPRPAVSGWLFALLGLLYMKRTALIASEKESGEGTEHPRKVLHLVR